MTTLGQHFIVGFAGVELSDEERSLWRKLRPLGTIIFKRNILPEVNWDEKLKETLQELKELSGRETFVVSIDHEGGRVHRLIEPVTHFPPAAAWNDESEAVGRAMGKELQYLGVNLDFAPSFDVLVESRNKVIGDRAFSSDPELVSKRAMEFLKGLETEGVLGCAKHFPGHGGTIEDSHEVLPSVDTSKELLFKRELLPFKRYIDSGRTLIMTSHVLFKSIDPERPATLSQKILKDLLRQELGYKGAIITDALDMGALSGFSPGDVAQGFIEASGDLFCVCQLKDGLPIQAALTFAEELERRSLSNAKLKAMLEESKPRIALFEDTLRIVSTSAVKSITLEYPGHHALNIQLREESRGVV